MDWIVKSKLRSPNRTQLIAFALVLGGAAFSPTRPLEPPNEELSPVSPDAPPTMDYLTLALHWAPAIYQDTDASNYVGDYLTHFNFDGDYVGKNNWENLEGRTTVPAYVYYAVSETKTHWFLNYSVFHPQDWHEWNPLDRHENDIEGISLAIKKGPGFGELIAMETMAHDVFYQYTNHPGITSGLDDIDGPITFWGGSHPRVFSEAKGHGLYGCDRRCSSAPGGDGILYVPGDRAESPSGGDGNYTRQVRYALIAMDADGSTDGNQGFWYRRNDICDDCTFGSWGRLRGDNYGTNRAKMPWVWTGDKNGPLAAGSMLCDPAFFFDAHLNGTPFEDFSHEYVAHAFRTHETTSDVSLKLLSGPTSALAAVTSLPRAFAPRREAGARSFCLPEAAPPRHASGSRVSALTPKLRFSNETPRQRAF